MRGMALVAVVMVCACTTIIDYDPDAVERPIDPLAFASDDAVRHLMAERNRAAFRRYRSIEWSANQSDTSAPPSLCVALSGGGVRSASFSMGVLAGLADLGLLGIVDVVSAVSGGSYTTMWYVLSRVEHPKVSLGELFRPSGPHQMQVENSIKYVMTALDGVLARGILSLPFSFFNNLVFDERTPSVAFARYARGLYGAFVLPTARSGMSFSAASREALKETLIGRLPTMSSFAPELGPGGPPLFVFNATLESPAASLTSEQIFEITPLAMGSDYVGYYLTGAPLMINAASALSAAAVDSSNWSTQPIGFLPRLLGLDTGADLENYTVSNATRWLHKWLPWPLYYAHRYQRDSSGVSIYLSDGGFSENLGAFGLVRRGCGRIVIVDAEYDPKGRFVGYQRLKKSVESELGARFTVPAIDGHLETAPEELADGPWVGPGFVFKGEVSGLTHAADRDSIALSYVKLGLARDHLRSYPAEVQRLAGVSSDFPQEATWLLLYSTRRFRAYRDLGRYIVTTELGQMLREESAIEELDRAPSPPRSRALN